MCWVLHKPHPQGRAEPPTGLKHSPQAFSQGFRADVVGLDSSFSEPAFDGLGAEHGTVRLRRNAPCRCRYADTGARHQAICIGDNQKAWLSKGRTSPSEAVSYRPAADVMSRTFARECLVGASFCDLTGFCGYLFAQGYPCQIAHGIVCPGLKGPAAESLLFPERIVSTAFG
jgi:hypothetical protein